MVCQNSACLLHPHAYYGTAAFTLFLRAGRRAALRPRRGAAGDFAAPLSVAIRQLEDSIGARLFERNSKEVRRTPAGRPLRLSARKDPGAGGRSGAGSARRGREPGRQPAHRFRRRRCCTAACRRRLRGFQARYPGVRIKLTEVEFGRSRSPNSCTTVWTWAYVHTSRMPGRTGEPSAGVRAFRMLPAGSGIRWHARPACWSRGAARPAHPGAVRPGRIARLPRPSCRSAPRRVPARRSGTRPRHWLAVVSTWFRRDWAWRWCRRRCAIRPPARRGIPAAEQARAPVPMPMASAGAMRAIP